MTPEEFIALTGVLAFVIGFGCVGFLLGGVVGAVAGASLTLGVIMAIGAKS